MKKLMFFAVLSIMMGMTQVAVAQEANPTKVEVVRNGNTFTPVKKEKEVKSKEPIATRHFYTYEDKDYPVFIGPRGGCYINIPDKKGGQKKWYIDSGTADTIRKEMGIEKPKNKQS